MIFGQKEFRDTSQIEVLHCKVLEVIMGKWEGQMEKLTTPMQAHLVNLFHSTKQRRRDERNHIKFDDVNRLQTDNMQSWHQ